MNMPLPDLMSDHGPPEQMVEIGYAKVNLALHVRERRADGYHALESLFVFARHGDVLTACEQGDGGISLRIEGPFGTALGTGDDNLVVKAARALQDHLGERRGAALMLTKNLPVASGIGGGSADAAATLRLLLRLWKVSIPAPELEKLALALGSDVPACLSSVTQLVRGRGEVLEDLEIKGLAGTPMLLVNPGVALSTARVFAGWDRVDRGGLIISDINGIVAHGRNDLEASAVGQAPAIADVLEMLRPCGGLRLTRMSGSGATCFALFDDFAAMSDAADCLRQDRPDWWIMETEIRAA